MEGGNPNESQSSINLDELDQKQKDFVEDVSVNTPAKFRFFVLILIVALQLSVLIIYSIDGIINTKGSLIWVIVFFASQVLSFFIFTPVLFLATSSYISHLYK